MGCCGSKEDEEVDRHIHEAQMSGPIPGVFDDEKPTIDYKKSVAAARQKWEKRVSNVQSHQVLPSTSTVPSNQSTKEKPIKTRNKDEEDITVQKNFVKERIEEHNRVSRKYGRPGLYDASSSLRVKKHRRQRSRSIGSIKPIDFSRVESKKYIPPVLDNKRISSNRNRLNPKNDSNKYVRRSSRVSELRKKFNQNDNMVKNTKSPRSRTPNPKPKNKPRVSSPKTRYRFTVGAKSSNDTYGNNKYKKPIRSISRRAMSPKVRGERKKQEEEEVKNLNDSIDGIEVGDDLDENEMKQIINKNSNKNTSKVSQNSNNNNELPTKSFKDRLSAFNQGLRDMEERGRLRANTYRDDRKDSYNVDVDSDQMRRASALLNDYTKKKATVARQRKIVDTAFLNLTRDECLESLEKMNILYKIIVPKNKYIRWNKRNGLRVDINLTEYEKEELIKDNIPLPKLYNDREPNNDEIIMYVLLLQGNGIVTQLTLEQKKKFRRLICWGIEDINHLYRLDFTQSAITNEFLSEICKSCLIRYKNNNKFGPEEIHLESNPISDRGIESMFNLINYNTNELKCIRVGNSFGTISTKICNEFCNVIQTNNYLLKVNIDFRWKQYKQRLDKVLTTNNKQYRLEKNKFQQNNNE